jgi:protein-disulfide isomerase
MKVSMLAAAFLFGSAAILPQATAAPREKAQMTRDWSTTVTRTAAGAYVLGNPEAKVRVVEYLSLTCNHCADFQREGAPILKNKYVKPGLVALEVRHAVRDGYDMGATLLARCGGPKAYFGRLDRLFAAQEQWIDAARRWAQLEGDKLRTMSRDDALFAMTQGAGTAMARAVGPMSAKQMRACVSNEAEQKALAAMAEEAWGSRKIRGTPAFIIDGQEVVSPVWKDIETRIEAAL